MNKFKCNICTYEFFSDDLEDAIKSHQEDYDETHKVKKVTLTAEDYVEMWEIDLEDENRHSLSDMPSQIFGVLSLRIKDSKVVKKIMKDLYELGIGLG